MSWENRGSERLRNSLKVTQPKSASVGIQTQVSVLHGSALPMQERPSEVLGFWGCLHLPWCPRRVAWGGAAASLLAPSLLPSVVLVFPSGSICFGKARDGIRCTWLSFREHTGGCHLPRPCAARRAGLSGMGEGAHMGSQGSPKPRSS